MFHLIKAADYTEQPWKNGGGLTHEIAADDFWRVSIATIDREGPFSEYRGYDRTIVAIEGDPVELQVGSETIALTPYEPFEFAGEEPVYARVRGRARDFNVMTRRDEMAHDVEIVSGHHRFVIDEDEFALVYATAETRVEDFTLAAGDTLAIEDVEAFTVQTSGHAIVVRLTER